MPVIASKKIKIALLKIQIEDIENLMTGERNLDGKAEKAMERREKAIKYFENRRNENCTWTELRKMFNFDYHQYYLNKKP